MKLTAVTAERWVEFRREMAEALAAFVTGDAFPYQALWSHSSDVTIFGGWGAWEQGWEAVSARLGWAAARYLDGWMDIEEIRADVDEHLACTVDIERSGGRLDGAAESVPAPLRVTHAYRLEAGRWRVTHRHADFLQPRQMQPPGGASGVASTANPGRLD